MRGKFEIEVEVHLKRSLWKHNLRHFEVFDEDYQDFLCKLGILFRWDLELKFSLPI